MCDDDTDTDTPIHIKPTDPLYKIIKQLKEDQERIKEDKKKDTFKTPQSEEENIKRQDANKLKYYEYEQLTKLIKIITENDGKVFGGCTRDLILREVNTHKFWKYCRDNNYNFINNFYNPTICPETYYGRTKLPNDIDIQCIYSSIEKLLKTFKELGFTLTKLEVPELYRLYYGINRDKYKLEYKPQHNKTNTTLEKLYNKQLYYSIKIDIIYASTQKELDKYFDTKLDFMCNQLQITSAYEREDKIVFNYECLANILKFIKEQNGNSYKSSIDNSLLPYELLKNIIKQIEERKAYVLFPDAYRIDKMMKKEYIFVYIECISYLNYYIKKESLINKFKIICVDTPEECIVCLNNEDTTTNTLEFLNIKVKCCSNNHNVCLKCFIINLHSQYEQEINLSCSLCREEGIYMTPQLIGDLTKFIIKLAQLEEN